MITKCFEMSTARKVLSEPDRANHAAVIEMRSIEQLTEKVIMWGVVCETSDSALLQLDTIEAQQGNYKGTTLVSLESGPAISFVRKYAVPCCPAHCACKGMNHQ